MLEKAEKYQKAFERLEEEDPNYLMTIREEAKEDGDDIHEVAWGMDDVEWEKIRIFSKFLKIFYDATMRFSGANYVTSNSFFLELMSIHDTIDLEYEKDSYLLRKMAENMKTKFEKYWENFDNMNHLLYVRLVLDPRYKMRYLEYYFGTLYENQKAVDMAERVKAVLVDLYNTYSQNQVGSSSASAAAQAQGQKPSGSMEGDNSSVVDAKAMRMMGFKKRLSNFDSSNTKSEVDNYLLESCEDVFDDNFDILAWWKVNSPRNRVLSRVA
ncbi:zinc finger BED domain-containing protein RICESLEEPER 1-like [Castanea sativa]|uniref:zinc finger BED domain-containing protein RICESLEEPER 1-like n=1 Tax=Castanea sativa TaxID=21020 RepID=UPI003F653FFE